MILRSSREPVSKQLRPPRAISIHHLLPASKLHSLHTSDLRSTAAWPIGHRPVVLAVARLRWLSRDPCPGSRAGGGRRRRRRNNAAQRSELLGPNHPHLFSVVP